MRTLVQLALEGCFVAAMLLTALALRLLRHFLRPSAGASSPAVSAELASDKRSSSTPGLSSEHHSLRSRRMTQFLVGLDVGSTTVKAIVVDAATDKVIWQDYQRHETRQPEKVLEFEGIFFLRPVSSSSLKTIIFASWPPSSMMSGRTATPRAPTIRCGLRSSPPVIPIW
jgi:hypothetical protein